MEQHNKHNHSGLMTAHEDHTHMMYHDPVCGMSTDDERAFLRHEHQGNTYYFWAVSWLVIDFSKILQSCAIG